MGEYARFNGNTIKLGTCESMYYVRFEDRDKVQPESHSLNAATAPGLFWRLPFPDEDDNGPGNYPDYNRGLRLYRVLKDPENSFRPDRVEDFEDTETVSDPGIIQLTHKCGLLLNVPCYHGIGLPQVQKPMQAFWNGRGHFFELASVKDHPGRGLMPVVHCRHCGHMWRYEWAEILPFVAEEVMLGRLTVYASMCSPASKAA